MKIGIDVHSIGSGSGGNETYYRGLVEALQVIDRSSQYVLYSSGKAAEIARVSNNFTAQYVPQSPYLRIPISLPLSVRRDRLDAYHAQFIIPPFLRCKTVTTIPDIAFEHVPEMFPAYQRLWSRTLIRCSACAADHILTVSEYSKRDLVKTYRLPSERITVTPLAAPSELFPRDKDLSRELMARKYAISSPYLLYVGRLQGRKNLPTLVSAFARLARAGCGHKLVIAGGRDTLSQSLMSAIQCSGVASDIILPGYIAAGDLPFVYSAADVFIYPSLYEGFGLPVLEAMACGIPVITSRNSAMEEVAGSAALLIDPLDDITLAQAITSILEDAPLGHRLSGAGLARSATFSYRRTAELTLRVYQQLCGIEISPEPAFDPALERRLCS